MAIRTFVALEISDETRAALRAAQKAMGRLPAVRWANPETIHLTLKFIGDIEDSLVPAVFTAMREAAAGVGPLEFAVRGLGWFPPGRRPRVLWAGVDMEGTVLTDLARRLDESLYRLGVPSDGRPFRPHVTLGRVRGPLDTEAAGEAVARAGRKDFGFEVAEEMVLFMSELLPSGAAHTRMGAVPLEGGNEEES